MDNYLYLAWRWYVDHIFLILAWYYILSLAWRGIRCKCNKTGI